MLRINCGLTQSDLGNELGISGQAVSKWETGIVTPDIALLPVIARRFGITIDALLLGEDGVGQIAQPNTVSGVALHSDVTTDMVTEAEPKKETERNDEVESAASRSVTTSEVGRQIEKQYCADCHSSYRLNQRHCSECHGNYDLDEQHCQGCHSNYSQDECHCAECHTTYDEHEKHCCTCHASYDRDQQHCTDCHGIYDNEERHCSVCHSNYDQDLGHCPLCAGDDEDESDFDRDLDVNLESDTQSFKTFVLGGLQIRYGKNKLSIKRNPS